jgi:hypothetical protein
MVYTATEYKHIQYCKVCTVNLLQRKTAYSYQEKEHSLNRLTVNYSAECRFQTNVFSCILMYNKRREIRMIESNAKCRYLKKLTCKGTLQQVLSV